METTLQPTGRRPRRIAVIDDSPNWQYQIQRHLKAIDSEIDVKVSVSAEDFFEQSEPDEFDLIISDHFLGAGQTGLSIWRELKSRNCNVPFALTSGLDKKQLARLTASYLEEPVYIEKPYQFNDFKNQVNLVLGGSRSLEISKSSAIDWAFAKEALNSVGMIVVIAAVILFGFLADMIFQIKWPAPEIDVRGAVSSVPKVMPLVPSVPVKFPKPRSLTAQLGQSVLSRQLQNQVQAILVRADQILAERPFVEDD